MGADESPQGRKAGIAPEEHRLPGCCRSMTGCGMLEQLGVLVAGRSSRDSRSYDSHQITG